MVTPYPPIRDGIASYAVQAVKGLRAEGHDVEVLSPGPSAAHHHLDLVGPRGALALAKRVGSYDKLIVQFHPDFFYPVPSTARDRVEVSLALLAAFRRAGEVEVVVHEIDYRHGRLSMDGLVHRLLWSSVDRIVVHTENERRTFARAFGVSPTKIRLTEHGVRFLPRTFYDRSRARASLGIPQDAFTFLSIGFIQPHKGFDRAVRAFAGLGARGCRLDIVGSVRIDDPGYVAYSNELGVLARATDGVDLHDGYVSDELFDRWIVAADVVVLPYRSIWSSGVLERAALYDRPIIATAVGGLPEQAAAGRAVTLVDDDAGLAAAMAAAEPASSGRRRRRVIGRAVARRRSRRHPGRGAPPRSAGRPDRFRRIEGGVSGGASQVDEPRVRRRAGRSLLAGRAATMSATCWGV